MGSRGPRSKPSALKALECSINHPHTSTCFSDRRPLNQKEAKPAKFSDLPEPPSYLSAATKKEWRELVPELAGCGLATKIDRMALIILFDAWDEMLKLRAFIRKHGYWYVVDKGEDDEQKKDAKTYRTQHPEVAAWRTCVEIVRKQLSEFGMTPSARSRIEVELRIPLQDGEKTEQKQDKFFRANNQRA